jgi:hypothetical protein
LDFFYFLFSFIIECGVYTPQQGNRRSSTPTLLFLLSGFSFSSLFFSLLLTRASGSNFFVFIYFLTRL